MSRWEDDLVDPFLADLPEEEEHVDELVSVLEGDLGPIAPPAALRDAILGAARTEGRHDRFAPVIAELLDVDTARASALLDGIDRAESWIGGPVPGTSLYHVEGGPRVQEAVTGFVRMPQGAVFPEHEHLGDEAVLVVQGSFEDGVTGQIHRPGDLVRMPAGTAHDFRVRPGPALVYLVVLREGVRIGDVVLKASDPQL